MKDRDSEYKAYMRKLQLADLDKYISISKEKDDYVLKNVSYDFPYNTLKIPSFITKLEDACCSGTKLKTVYISMGVSYIGCNCFANCNKLECIYIHPSLLCFVDKLKSANKALFLMKTL